MTYTGQPFPADDPLVDFVIPAHPDNVMRDRNTGEHKPINHARGFVIHTPEEAADNVEVTPYYFSRKIYDQQGRQRFASTTFYGDNSGPLYQMVPVRFGAIANGVNGKPYPAWADPNVSLNYQTESIELEGYAATIHLTCPRGGPQWTKTARLLASRSVAKGWPLDRVHVIGHYEVAVDRTDPGGLDLNALVQDARGFLTGAILKEAAMIRWVTAGVYGRDKTYLVFVTEAGLRRMHIKDAAQENALLAAGLIKKPVTKITQAQLDQYADV